MPGFRSRKQVPELMDDPGIDAQEHLRALAGLRRLNWLSDSAGLLWPPICSIYQQLKRPIRILDVATGSGDVPAQLIMKAKRSGIPLELFGCDVSSTAVSTASTVCPDGRFFAHDVLREPLPDVYDVVICSLFLHHLSEDQAVLLLQRMQLAAIQLVLVNDLVRSLLNFSLVWATTRLITFSKVVRFDGPASVRSAFTKREVTDLAHKAGLEHVTVRTRFPCRYLLTWKRA
jgi:2-polyprenyl-3-methyl-5-hydroxy-6-metoxy-1,4-benzoquinol methylase